MLAKFVGVNDVATDAGEFEGVNAVATGAGRVCGCDCLTPHPSEMHGSFPH